MDVAVPVAPVVEVWLDVHAAGIFELVALALGSALGEVDVEVLVRHVRVRVTVMVAGDDETAAERLDLETAFPVVSSATVLRVDLRLGMIS